MKKSCPTFSRSVIVSIYRATASLSAGTSAVVGASVSVGACDASVGFSGVSAGSGVAVGCGVAVGRSAAVPSGSTYPGAGDGAPQAVRTMHSASSSAAETDSFFIFAFLSLFLISYS